jgi:hypothetical protein
MLVALTTHLSIPRYEMNSSSERMWTELRIARAFVKLSSIPEDGSKASVSLVSIGDCEIRMFRGPEACSALFWLELFDHGTRMSVDSFGCNKIEEAGPVFEHLMSQAADSNDPDANEAEAH